MLETEPESSSRAASGLTTKLAIQPDPLISKTISVIKFKAKALALLVECLPSLPYALGLSPITAENRHGRTHLHP